MFKEKLKSYMAAVTSSEYKVAIAVSFAIATIWTIFSVEISSLIFAFISTMIAIGGIYLYSKNKDTTISPKDYAIAVAVIFLGSIFIESVSFMEILIIGLVFAVYYFLKNKQK